MADPYEALPPIWQARFKFYDKFGRPSSPEGRAALQQFPSGSRFQIKYNFWAFLFSPIYFFVKGMWRKGVSLLGVNIAIALAVAAAQWPPYTQQLGNLAAGVLGMFVANWAYYLHITQRSVSWNPFEGMSGPREIETL